ncbi:H(+)/Cl(-) exchange transporter ClcA [Pannus brasiliensis CCIBt3594]|uniref:H(+)/Cl(-) exchange transporter ClcA n=1 Tax=Pannus brasiliensis CCIBt3594 TaxID=1427578 RepID=A0AAW9QR87_9CHRO
MAEHHARSNDRLSSPSTLKNIPWTARFREATKKLTIVLLWALVVGAITGLVGSAFRLGVEALLNQRQILANAVRDTPVLAWLVPTLVAGGMVQISFYLVRRFAPETAGSGIPQVEGAIDGLLPFEWRRILPVKFFGGLLSIGAGMIAGFEGPTIQMGGSIGQMVGQWAKLDRENLRILIAAGAGAGLTTAFNAPIAGILFVTEEVRPKFRSWIVSYRAVMIACITATIVLRLILGQKAFLKIERFEIVPLDALWMFLPLGIALGILGYLFNLFLFRAIDFFSGTRGWFHRGLGFLVGGTIGFLGWWYAPLVGGGDGTVIWSLDNHSSAGILWLVLLGRFALTLLCYGSGEIGGIFAPMLALATLLSLALAKTFDTWFPHVLPEPGVFAVAGMGGLVAATVRAPLTAALLTFELTDNFSIILPMLITCVSAAIVAHFLGGEPVYSVLLRRACERASDETLTDQV